LTLFSYCGLLLVGARCVSFISGTRQILLSNTSRPVMNLCGMLLRMLLGLLRMLGLLWMLLGLLRMLGMLGLLGMLLGLLSLLLGLLGLLGQLLGLLWMLLRMLLGMLGMLLGSPNKCCSGRRTKSPTTKILPHGLRSV